MDILYVTAVGMLLLIIIFIAAVSIAFIYLLLGSCFCYFSPAVPSSGFNKKCILENIGRILKEGKGLTVMDLGSGWGGMLFSLAKQFPQHRFIGVERGFLPFFVSKFRCRHCLNVSFFRGDFFIFDISSADVVIIFQLARLMRQITEKCRRECHSGCVIYANRFPLEMKPTAVLTKGKFYETVYQYNI